MQVTTEYVSRRTCATYAGDMHALELHMLEAFERQIAITKETREANLLVLALVSTSKRHSTILNDLVSSLGDVEKMVTDKLKSAFAGFMGMAAGLVDTVRPMAASKALRDDYTALNHAIVGYVMLSTTATALRNEVTRKIADEFLSDYINLSQQIMTLIPSLALKDLSDEGIQLLDINAATQFKSDKQWASLFTREIVAANAAPVQIQETHQRASIYETNTPNVITIERTIGGQPVTVGVVEKSIVETIVKPVIIEETFRPEKIIEVQPIVHRDIQATEIHHIERHIYEKVETTGPTVVTNKAIVQEVIHPRVIEEVQEIVHRELPAPYVEKVERHMTEVEVMPTLHTKEVIMEKEEVHKAALVVEERVVVPATVVQEKVIVQEEVVVPTTILQETVIVQEKVIPAVTVPVVGLAEVKQI